MGATALPFLAGRYGFKRYSQDMARTVMASPRLEVDHNRVKKVPEKGGGDFRCGSISFYANNSRWITGILHIPEFCPFGVPCYF